MKIVLAPDKFKGNMTSPEICEVIRKAFLLEMPEAEIVSVPLAEDISRTAAVPFRKSP